jgi:hypothetical protein
VRAGKENITTFLSAIESCSTRETQLFTWTVIDSAFDVLLNIVERTRPELHQRMKSFVIECNTTISEKLMWEEKENEGVNGRLCAILSRSC